MSNVLNAMLRELASGRDSETFASLTADSVGVAGLLTPSVLGEYLQHPLVRYPQVRVALGGKGVPSSAYVTDRRVGTGKVDDGIDAERVAAFLGRGATITVDSLEYLSDPVRAICDDLTREFGLSTTATAYVTPPGKQGLSPHTDEEDVIVLQTFGTKRWIVDSAQRLEVPVGASFPFNSAMAATDPFLLAPGDAFYMPAGTPHVATATDELSIHITFSVERPRVADLLVHAIRTAQSEDPALGRLQDWRSPEASASITADMLIWRSLLGAVEEPAIRPALPFAGWELLASREVLARRVVPVTTEEADGKVALSFPEVTLKVDGPTGRILAGISDSSFDPVPIAGDPDLKEVLFHLVARGLIEVRTSVTK